MEITISWMYDGYDPDQHRCHKYRRSDNYHFIASAKMALNHFLDNPSRFSDIKVHGKVRPRQISAHYRIGTVEFVEE